MLFRSDGKYIKYNHIRFKKDSSLEIDLTKHKPNRPDKKSKDWINIRAFKSVMGNSKRITKMNVVDNYSSDSSDSGIEICGYVLAEDNVRSISGTVFYSGNDFYKRIAYSESDGYFAGQLYDTNEPLCINFGQVYFPIELFLTVDCGFFIVMKKNHEFDNVRYGSDSQ